MAGELLLDEPADGVLRLTISNPAKRNALDHAILDGDRRRRCDGVGDARAACCSPAPTGCSPRATTSATSPTTSSPTRPSSSSPTRSPSALDALDACDRARPSPRCRGHTIGGGLELALACDLRVAADGIKLGMPPAKLGLVYSHTGLRRFIDAIGAPRTRELFLLGAQRRRAHGAELGPRQRRRRARPTSRTPRSTGRASWRPTRRCSVRGNKRVIRELLRGRGRARPRTSSASSSSCARRASRSEDMREGVRAFGEKRPARWQGR